MFGFTLALATAGCVSQAAGTSGSADLRTVDIKGSRVIAIRDGIQPAVSATLTNIAPPLVKEALASAGEGDPAPSPVNAYVLRLGERVVLVDAGGGSGLPPYRGTLGETLRRAGIEPAQVTDILITHMHADHVGGLMEGSRMRYPNAKVHVHADEAGFWLSPELPKRAPEQFRHIIVAIQGALGPYAASGRLATFRYQDEPVPGIVAMDAGGHTPGHTAFLWKQEGTASLFWGDLVHVAAVQFAHPNAGSSHDFNADGARQARQRLLADASRQGWTIFGAHLPFPGVGTVEFSGNRYRWCPDRKCGQ